VTTQPPAIEFNEVEHSYKVNGRPVPGVTKLLQIIQTLEGIPWDVLEAARIFGTNVHRACHLENIGELDHASLSPILRDYVRGYTMFLRDTRFAVLASELPVASPLHGFAGTLDLFGVLNQAEAVIDIKSTMILPFTVGPQTAAYKEGLERTTGQKAKKRFCLMLGANRYRLVELTDPQDLTYFISCMNVVKLMQRCGKLGNVTPY